MAYDLKATLKLNDEFSSPMRNILRIFDDVERQMREVDRLWTNVEQGASQAAQQVNAFNTQTNNSVSQINNLGDQLQQATTQADNLSNAGNDIGGNLDAAGTVGQTAGNKISTAFKTAAGIIASVIAVDQIKDLTVSMVESAGSAKAMKAQFSEVFGDLEGQAAGKLGAISEETTILESRMKESFTKIAAFAKTGGMDTADSLDLADRSMRVIADSAAFYDKALDDTTESLQSFLKGKIVAPRRCEAA